MLTLTLMLVGNGMPGLMVLVFSLNSLQNAAIWICRWKKKMQLSICRSDMISTVSPKIKQDVSHQLQFNFGSTSPKTHMSNVMHVTNQWFSLVIIYISISVKMPARMPWVCLHPTAYNVQENTASWKDRTESTPMTYVRFPH